MQHYQKGVILIVAADVAPAAKSLRRKPHEHFSGQPRGARRGHARARQLWGRALRAYGRPALLAPGQGRRHLPARCRPPRPPHRKRSPREPVLFFQAQCRSCQIRGGPMKTAETCDGAMSPQITPATPMLLQLADLVFERTDGFTLCVPELHLACDEVLGVIGPNGSGKTSLLSCLLGTAQAGHGWVALLGDPAGWPWPRGSTSACKCRAPATTNFTSCGTSSACTASFTAGRMPPCSMRSACPPWALSVSAGCRRANSSVCNWPWPSRTIRGSRCSTNPRPTWIRPTRKPSVA